MQMAQLMSESEKREYLGGLRKKMLKTGFSDSYIDEMFEKVFLICAQAKEKNEIGS